MSGEGRPRLLYGCVAGARHLRDDRPCQDAIHHATRDGVLAVAVADGHGSSRHGDVGAQRAVAAAVTELLAFAAAGAAQPVGEADALAAIARHDELRERIVHHWVRAVSEHATSSAPDAMVDLVPYGSTLLFALATSGQVLLGQLGDGDIVVVDAAGTVTRPMPIDEASFGDETRSLCQDKAWSFLRLVELPTPLGEAMLFMSTDGYAKSYPSDDAFAAVARDYLGLLREHGADAVERNLPAFLATVSAQGSGDDVSLALLHWPSANAPTESP